MSESATEGVFYEWWEEGPDIVIDPHYDHNGSRIHGRKFLFTQEEWTRCCARGEWPILIDTYLSELNQFGQSWYAPSPESSSCTLRFQL